MKKKLFVLIVVTFLASVGLAYGAELNFEWQQTIPDDMEKWTLYISNTSGANFSKLVDVSYSGTVASLYTATVTRSIAENETVYFVLTASDDAGNESGYSNEVSYTGEDIPPSSPQQLNLTIITN